MQVVSRLTGDLPVVIEAENWEETAEEIDDLVLGIGEVWRRPSAAGGVAEKSPSGGDFPYVSPEGHNILDVKFCAPLPPCPPLLSATVATISPPLPTPCAPLHRWNYRCTGKVWQAVNIGKAPSKPGNPILFGTWSNLGALCRSGFQKFVALRQCCAHPHPMWGVSCQAGAHNWLCQTLIS